MSYMCVNHHGVCSMCYQRLPNKICPTCRGPFVPPSAAKQRREQLQAIKESIANNTEESAMQANHEGRGMQNANWTFDSIAGVIDEWHQHKRRMSELEGTMLQWFSYARMRPLTNPVALTSTYTGNPHNNANVTRGLKALTAAGAKLLTTAGRARQHCRSQPRHTLDVVLQQMEADMDGVRTVGINVKDAIDNPPRRRRRAREDAAGPMHRDVRQRVD